MSTKKIIKSRWFTITKIDDETYDFCEQKHWEKVHSYLLIGKKRAILIDAGIGIDDIKKEIKKVYDGPVEDVYLTHAHYDHFVGAAKFKYIHIHPNDYGWLINFPLTLDFVKNDLSSNRQVFPKWFDINNYKIPKFDCILTINDNEIIDLGERKIMAILTQGHTPGHLCYYDTKKHYLFSGDQIYSGELEIFYEGTDPKKYAQSLERLLNLPINKILPGHYDLEIDVNIIKNVDDAFKKIQKEDPNFIKHGIYYFNDFSIHY